MKTRYRKEWDKNNRAFDNEYWRGFEVIADNIDRRIATLDELVRWLGWSERAHGPEMVENAVGQILAHVEVMLDHIKVLNNRGGRDDFFMSMINSGWRPHYSDDGSEVKLWRLAGCRNSITHGQALKFWEATGEIYVPADPFPIN